MRNTTTATPSRPSQESVHNEKDPDPVQRETASRSNLSATFSKAGVALWHALPSLSGRIKPQPSGDLELGSRFSTQDNLVALDKEVAFVKAAANLSGNKSKKEDPYIEDITVFSQYLRSANGGVNEVIAPYLKKIFEASYAGKFEDHFQQNGEYTKSTEQHLNKASRRKGIILGAIALLAGSTVGALVGNDKKVEAKSKEGLDRILNPQLGADNFAGKFNTGMAEETDKEAEEVLSPVLEYVVAAFNSTSCSKESINVDAKLINDKGMVVQIPYITSPVTADKRNATADKAAENLDRCKDNPGSAIFACDKGSLDASRRIQSCASELKDDPLPTTTQTAAPTATPGSGQSNSGDGGQGPTNEGIKWGFIAGVPTAILSFVGVNWLNNRGQATSIEGKRELVETVLNATTYDENVKRLMRQPENRATTEDRGSRRSSLSL